MGTSIGPEICYCLVLEDDDPLKTTPFQGFSPGWLSLTRAMARLVELLSSGWDVSSKSLVGSVGGSGREELT